jgi:hypothetical protein
MRAKLTSVGVVLVTTVFVLGCSQGSSPTAAPSAIPTSPSSTNDVVGQDVGQPGQVRICHFQGHEGPVSHDFVTGVQQGGDPVVCNAEGGLAMWVSRDACKEGHAAINRLGTTCDATQTAPIRFDFEELALGGSSGLSTITSTKSGLTLTVTRHDNASINIQNLNSSPIVPDYGNRSVSNFFGLNGGTSSDAALVLNFSAPISSASISFGDLGGSVFDDDDSPVVLTAFSGPNGTGSNLGSTSVDYPITLGFTFQGNGAIRTATVNAVGIQSLTISSGGPFPGTLYYDNVIVH